MPPQACPFCHRAASWKAIEGAVHFLQAGCHCGAAGVSSGDPADADEAADHLLRLLGLHGRLSPEPPHDADRTTRELEAFLRSLGYRLALERGDDSQPGERRAYWAMPGAGALLETPRLILRELEEADAPAANMWESDPEVTRYQSIDVSSAAGTLAYIRRVRLDSAQRPRLLYELGAVRRDDGLLVGRVGLRVTRPEHREGELWFAFRRDVWGSGYGGEAAGALLDLAFGRLGLHRVIGDCDPRNARSARLMERLGMQREAHLRENWWLKGEWCDSWIYSMLDREWASRSRRTRSRHSR